MKADDAFAAALEDLLAPLGPIRRARFFGGQGLRCGGSQFAMLMKGRLYLRADGALAARLRALGSEPFTYQTRRGPVTVGAYHEVPVDLLDDPEALRELAALALAAARSAP
ncbi:MAG TPA: TfoX/Sxy family protein [Holophagaceae bacterium]|nr:TfoX/Sxy family protein [Holophagaceae bacterium]